MAGNLNQSTDLLGSPDRCIHIGDRESDIYELFCSAQKAKTHFLIRTCVDRLTGDGTRTIKDEIRDIKKICKHQIEVRDNRGEASEAILDIKYHQIKVLPPMGKKKDYPELFLTVIHAEEKSDPKNRDRISWKLITDLPISSKKEVIEKLDWYALRWKVEIFFKILKSGCKAEESKLRTAEHLVNLIAIFCILSWRIFWMTMMNRVNPNAPPETALSEIEIKILDHFNSDHTSPDRKRKLSDYLIKIAMLGGYLARASDPPPGNIVMWRGMSRLTDIHLGISIASRFVGN